MKMAELRSVFTTIGLSESVTLLQSGNVVFSSDRSDPEGLASEIENAIGLAFGFHVDVVIRTRTEVARIITDHPFTEDQLDDPRMAHVMFFMEPPEAGLYGDLKAAHEGTEEMTINGRELYIHYPEGSGRSRLSGTAIERILGAKGTARNWNTVLKIAEEMAI
jgi:uncharacterized protein (DUF1697 family)